MSTLSGIKHLIRCRCILQQFKHLPEPPQHQFIVFSIISDDVVQPKFAQCNNCGIVHKVIDLCKSEIITNREDMSSLISINDIKTGLPQNLCTILEANNVDLPTWEACSFIYENQKWGEFVVLSADSEAGTRQGKILRILGTNMFKVEVFSREEYAKEQR